MRHFPVARSRQTRLVRRCRDRRRPRSAPSADTSWSDSQRRRDGPRVRLRARSARAARSSRHRAPAGHSGWCRVSHARPAGLARRGQRTSVGHHGAMAVHAPLLRVGPRSVRACRATLLAAGVLAGQCDQRAPGDRDTRAGDVVRLDGGASSRGTRPRDQPWR
jgi:hypothetical protein